MLQKTTFISRRQRINSINMKNNLTAISPLKIERASVHHEADFRIKVSSPKTSQPQKMVRATRLFSPPPMVRNTIMISDPDEYTREIENICSRLDHKVMLARKSRFSGLTSPNILKRKSRQFVSQGRSIRNESLNTRFQSEKISSKLDIFNRSEMESLTIPQIGF